MNFRASMVSLELMVTLPDSSCSAPPKDQRSARMAMLVSSSWERQTARMAGLVADFFGADAQLLPGIGAIGETDIGPPILVPVAGIGDVGIGKSEIALGLWIVSGFVGQIDFLAVAFLDFLVDRAHIDGLFLVGGGGRKKHEEIVAFFGGCFGGGFGRKVDEIDMVDNDVGIVFLSPLFAKRAVEPRVVSGDEVTPLEYFQR